MPASTPTRDQLQRALALAEQIHQLEQELAGIFQGGSAPVAPPPPSKAVAAKPGKRFVSAESRAKMAAAQAARWAKARGQSAGVAPVVAPKPAGKKKRMLSPEGRARIVAALKARHAANRLKAGKGK